MSHQTTVHNPPSAVSAACRALPPGPRATPNFGSRTSDFGLSRPSPLVPRPSSLAFTLIELMVVMGIMAIVMTISVPAIYGALHKEALRKAVADIVEVCSRARAQAILQGTMAELVFHPQEGRFEVAGVSSPPQPGNAEAAPAGFNLPAPGSGLAGQLPDSVVLDMLDVNLTEYKDAELARVRFYPNGTCDEMTIILRSDRNEQRGITLEITTGLATVLTDADLQKLRTGTL